MIHLGWTTRGIWAPGEPTPDQRVEFRAPIELTKAERVSLRIYAPCPYRVWIDDHLVAEGPSRFLLNHPEYSEWALDLAAGRHVVHILAHYEGVETRLMAAARPFVACQLSSGETAIEIPFEARVVDGYRSRMRRINPQLGWIDWQENPGSTAGWTRPVEVATLPNAPAKSFLQVPVRAPTEMRLIGEGKLVHRFGYANDDPPAGFFLRDLRPRVPEQGAWRRFDLGRVRLGRPEVTLDLPRGTVVEMAQSEALTDGRVAPWLTLSTGPSCNLDRFVATGGVETFTPTTSKGGRFVEVHVMSKPDAAKWVRSEFRERAYFGEPTGTFHCSDPRLDRIWRIGVDTLRACAEDAIIDNPTRERGQWMGDALTVGLEIIGVAYDDLALVRRAILQAAQGARGDGLVMGLGPGTPTFLPSYALHWIVSCERYLHLTGDRDFIDGLYGAIEHNAGVFLDRLTDEGAKGVPGWSFIDWGYEGGDLGLNLFAFRALQAMVLLANTIGKDHEKYTKALDRLRRVIDRRPSARFHFEALALHAQLAGDAEVVKRHMLACFPNDARAPRLANPSDAGPRLMTPFFSHFALDGLWRAGHGDFVLDQYRKGWGWALEQGLTTWPEVFDLRWSHCHQWSGCPTWQMTRHVLGLSPRFDIGVDVYEFGAKKCSLPWAEGTLPGPHGVHMRREGARIVVRSKSAVRVLGKDGRLSAAADRHDLQV